MRRAALLAVAGCAAALTAASAASASVTATGSLAGVPIATRVDSDVARILLSGDDEKLGQSARHLLAGARREPLDSEVLARLSRRLSVDAAAIWAVRRLAAEPANRRLAEEVDERVEELRSSGSAATDRSPGAEVLFAFVPGYGWRSDPSTGSDFARQRRVLDSFGMSNLLIETDERGTVEANASLVRRSLRRLAGSWPRIVVVSASKGGPEAAMALAEPVDPASERAVRGWVSVGGILRGSPHADRYARGLSGWFARTVFAFKGLDGRVIRNLGTEVRRPAFERLRFADSLRRVAWVAVPLSGQIRRQVRGRYRALRAHGPNDGLTLLADALVPGGRTLAGVGLDHYFLDPEIDLKTVALALIVAER